MNTNSNNNMKVSQICSELDNIIHKLNNINNSCKNQEEKKREEARQNNTTNNLDTRDIPAAGYNGPQSNRSNAYWTGSLRSFWVRY